MNYVTSLHFFPNIIRQPALLAFWNWLFYSHYLAFALFVELGIFRNQNRLGMRDHKLSSLHYYGSKGWVKPRL
uniref:Uncharacterized protein n=1 Tax=Panstrongylus lignarius TaxID=156445 RepID=A0A224XTY1_9HEMI